MSAIDFVKAHPVAIGGGVIGILVIFFIASNAGGGAAAEASPGVDDGQMNAGVQLQQLQSAYADSASKTAASLQLGMAALASQDKQAELSAHSTDYANTLAATVAQKGLEAQTFVSTLTAQVEGERIANDRAATAEQFATIRAQSAQQTKQTKTILAAQVKQAEIAARPKGLFSFIFG